MSGELLQVMLVPVCFVLAGLLGLRVGTPRSLAAALVLTGACHLAALSLSGLAVDRVPGTVGWHLLSQVLFGAGFACLVWIAARFPRGGPPNRLVTGCFGLAVAAPVVGGFAGPSPTVLGGGGDLRGPVLAILPEPLAVAAAVPLALLPVLAVVVFAVRFTRADRATRRLMAWPIVGIGIVGLLAASGILLGPRLPGVSDAAFLIGAPIVPLTVAFGPVRRRLLVLTERTTRLEEDLAARVAELEESRHRLSVAAEEERRRIERDLHDGAQQELLALMAHVERARGLSDTTARGEALETVAELARGAYATVRSVSHGVRPAGLDDFGPVAALRTLVRGFPLPMHVDVRGEESRRYSPEVEGAALSFASEALANLLKHSGAQHALLLIDAGERLRVRVEDDGAGGADPQGRGLRGLCDRVEAAGGSVTISSVPGRTVLEAELPGELP
ncbi:hypothetical protein DDE18_15370 [Nocardioides gansuensis]|uniref:histidine kinase n=1 Tax=Nocardioides gansuensis TaxID=2138300 RepID=A0A2T8F8L3_9ACTN|nr:histidine kinase [Nocardioides gansuensis]PVG82062.1 hypothetical protein DDE18_15370 [Nocardioides gansuensis]